MNKLTRAFFLCLAAIPLLVGVKAHADQCCADDSCRWDGCWNAGAELLYWRPCVCAWNYGSFTGTGPGVSTTERLLVKSSPDFGFRLFGGYEACDGCSFSELSWTYLRNKDGATVYGVDSKTLSVGPFPPSNGEAVNESVTALKYGYNRVLLRLGRHLLLCGCLNFDTFVGVEYIEVSRKASIDAVYLAGARNGHYGSKSEYYSAGLELGIGGEYALGCGVNIEGHLAAIATVGRRSLRYDSNSVTGSPSTPVPRGFNGDYPSHIHCVPGFDIKLGFNYLLECGCSEVLVGVGYQLTHFFHVIQIDDPAIGVGMATVPPLRAPCVDVGFGGPYLSFLFRF